MNAILAGNPAARPHRGPSSHRRSRPFDDARVLGAILRFTNAAGGSDTPR